MKHRIFFFLYKILGLILCLTFWDSTFFWWIMVGFLLIYLSIVFLGSHFISLNWFVKSVNQNTEEGVSFTFDDGPHPKNTALILKTLKEMRKVKKISNICKNKLIKKKIKLLRYQKFINLKQLK